MKYSTIPRVSARPRRGLNPWIVGNDLGPVPRARIQKEKRTTPPEGKAKGPCAYCGNRMGVTWDHVVPKSYRVNGLTIPAELSGTVPACYDCNILKGARRLIPASWADRLTELTEAFPGTPWRVWDGNTKSGTYRETHI